MIQQQSNIIKAQMTCCNVYLIALTHHEHYMFVENHLVLPTDKMFMCKQTRVGGMVAILVGHRTYDSQVAGSSQAV